jgi:RNA 2',3'-cyclic 3'-phosphodiesterase
MMRLMERRLFVALPLPHDISLMLDGAVAELESRFPRTARITPQEQWHITILFIGTVPDESVAAINAALRALAVHEPVAVELGRITYGPPERPPRMVWLTTTDATSRRLSELQSGIMRNLRAEGVPFAHGEFGGFSGHITLARFGNVPNPSPLDETFPHRFVAGELLLMESVLSRGGPEYEELGRFALPKS